MVCGIGMRTDLLQRIFPRKRAAVPRLGFWILLFVRKRVYILIPGRTRDRKVCDAIGPRRPAPPRRSRCAGAAPAAPPRRRRAARVFPSHARRCAHAPALPHIAACIGACIVACKQPPVPVLCLLLKAMRAWRYCRTPAASIRSPASPPARSPTCVHHARSCFAQSVTRISTTSSRCSLTRSL